MTRACPHCKSPARTNPCWWFVDHPEQSPSGGDPPCYGDEWAEDIERRQRRFGRRWAAFTAALVIVGLILFGVSRLPVSGW